MDSDSAGVKTISDGIEALDLKVIADKTLDSDTLSAPMVPFVRAN